MIVSKKEMMMGKRYTEMKLCLILLEAISHFIRERSRRRRRRAERGRGVEVNGMLAMVDYPNVSNGIEWGGWAGFGGALSLASSHSACNTHSAV